VISSPGSVGGAVSGGSAGAERPRRRRHRQRRRTRRHRRRQRRRAGRRRQRQRADVRALAAVGGHREVERARQLLLVEPGQVIAGRAHPLRQILSRADQRRQPQRRVERIGQRPRVGEALERRAREAAIDHPRHRARQLERRRPARHDRVLDVGRGGAGERADAAHHLVRQHAEREHVGRRGDALAEELLGREVRHPRGQGLVVRRPRAQPTGQDAEVGDLDVAVEGRDQVGRAQPAVDDAAAVGVADRARRRRDQRERGAGGQPIALVHRHRGDAPEVEAGHQLGRGEGLAGGDAELDQPRDPRVIEAAVRARRLL
jgi:hypothetical protein